MKNDESNIAEMVLGLERSANERWNKGDCTGYFEIYSEDLTYFDPVVARVLVGRKTVEAHIRGIYKNPHIIRSEYLNPEVTVSDDCQMAVLSYNLRNFIADEAGGEKIQAHWNSTEVYRHSGEKWRIVHSHWSFVQLPAIMQNVTA
jgi:uncharacterized protein (TIGR02246 family)